MGKNGNIHPTRIFNTPDDLLKAWEEYKQQLQEKKNEWFSIESQNGQKLKLPLTFEGFKVFCFKNYGQVDQYFKNKDGYYEDFVPVCKGIKEEIRNDQITGGLLGIYNASITQRLNNLAEKTEEVNPESKRPVFIFQNKERKSKK